MTKSTVSFLLIVWFLCTHLFPSMAQVSSGGTPPSFHSEFKSRSLQIFDHQLDMEKIKAEDVTLDGVRFAAPLSVAYNPKEVGTWTTLENGDRIWQLQLNAKKGLGIFVSYKNFNLPEGAKLFMYSVDRRQILGSYTSKNNKDHGKFMTGMIKGTNAVLEYYEPAQAKNKVPFEINKLYIAYHTEHIKRPATEFNAYSGFGDSSPCNVNINCPPGELWQDSKKGVVRILRIFQEGIGWCSGSLINNTSKDATPYILSAYHCIAGYTPELELWRFDFNFESTNCSSPEYTPDFQSLLGCDYRVGRLESDVLLLELEDDIPMHYNAVFNGWNRTPDYIPNSAVGIHHPRGDIKKIAIDHDSISIYDNPIFWSNGAITPPKHHYKLELDIGTIEDGSSGSALFDENGFIVGQLHGGNANCNIDIYVIYYGRFAISWEEGDTPDTRLKDWLDPLNTGQLTLDAYVLPFASISGEVAMPTGSKISGVKVYLSGSFIDSTMTDEDGQYFFNYLPKGENYILSLSKNTIPLNGVSLRDLILMQQHILGILSFSNPYQALAADVNDSGSVSAFDMIRLRELILINIQAFSNKESWTFAENDILISNLSEDFQKNIIGVKVGDVNFTADPQE